CALQPLRTGSFWVIWLRFCTFRAAPLGREMAFRKNSYFPRVSGVEEYCERQTPGLVFRSHCQFSDTGWTPGAKQAHRTARAVIRSVTMTNQINPDLQPTRKAPSTTDKKIYRRKVSSDLLNPTELEPAITPRLLDPLAFTYSKPVIPEDPFNPALFAIQPGGWKARRKHEVQSISAVTAVGGC
ncbi:MAG: hypothetical protein ACLPL7_17275, partial [Pseudomonas sp.]